jgi:tetratricopeptide (TPR) repeat protein
MADYTRATELSPNAALAYYNRAWAHYLGGENVQALADADRAIALNARSASAFSTRALIRERLADRAGAIADFREALKIDPSFQQPAEGLQRLKAGPASR